MWLSTDPALGEYIPGLDKDKNKNLPGMGGLFNQINANLFHAFGNSPVTYTDPDGRSIFIDDDASVKFINKYSYYQYAEDDEGYLYKTDKINRKGSKTYSEAIDRCIADENSEIILSYMDDNPSVCPFGIEKDLTEYGGGATFFDNNMKDPDEIWVYYMKVGNDNGKKISRPEQILMHEIVGHADPIAAGGDRDNENAIENENKVLEELKLAKFIRVVKPWHTAR